MKNTKKKILSLLLSAAMVLSLIPSVTPAAWAASNADSYFFDISEGNITISAGSDGTHLKVTYGSDGSDQITTDDILYTKELTIIGNSSNAVTVDGSLPGQVNIVLDEVNISAIGCAFSIGSGTTVNLTLSGSNSLSSGPASAGLQVPSGATLYINKESSDTDDSLSASSNNSSGSNAGSAGIGGGSGSGGGTIIINGGTINATGCGAGNGYGGAGIGGGDMCSNGSVTINGGYVVANCGNFAAGIGGGFYGGGGSVTINGGYVEAHGGNNAAGIGRGWYGSGGSAPVISGGSVRASSFSISPTDKDGHAVYPTTITGLPVSSAVTYAVGNGSAVSTYTYSDGYLYLYLPAGSDTTAIAIRNASGNTYSTSGTVSSTGTNTFAVLAISTSTLTKAKENTAYSMPVQATAAGTSPYTWSASGLPNELSIDSSTGVISGTPTSTGIYSVQVTLKDSYSPQLTASANFTLEVEAAMAISTSALPSAYAGSAYSATVSAVRGIAPYSWSTIGLPEGLSMNSSTGVISGMSKTTGTFSVTVTVKDSSVPQQSASSAISLVVASNTTDTYSLDSGSITIFQNSVDSAKLDIAYNGTQSQTVPSTDIISIKNTGTTSYTITVGGSITNPVNIVLDEVNISASGCAFSIGSGTTVNLTLSGSNSLSSSGGSTALCVPSGAILNIVNDADDIANSLTATGGGSVGAGIGGGGTVIINGGKINATGSGDASGPSGAGIGGGDHCSNGSVIINGGYVVAYSGYYAAGIGGGYYGGGGSVTINGGYVEAHGGYSAAGIGGGWNGSSGSTPVISGGSVRASSFSISPTDKDGHAVYPTTITGLPVSSAVTYAVGNGSAVSTYTYSDGYLYLYLPAGSDTTAIAIQDASGNTYGASGTVSSTGTNTFAVLAVTKTSLPDGKAFDAYSKALSATGGTGSYSWSVSGLPDGLSLDSSTGFISGTPEVAGSFAITVTVKDSGSPQLTASEKLTLSLESVAVTASATALTSATGSTTITLGSVISGLSSDNIVVYKDGTALNYTNDYTLSGLDSTSVSVTFTSFAVLNNTNALTVVITKGGYSVNGGSAISVTNSIPDITVTASASALTSATGSTTITLGSVISGLSSDNIVVYKDGTALNYTNDYTLSGLDSTSVSVTFTSFAVLNNTNVLTVGITKGGYSVNGGSAISVTNSIPDITVTASATALTSSTGSTTVTLGSVISGLVAGDIVVYKDNVQLTLNTDYTLSGLNTASVTVTFASSAALNNTNVLTVSITKGGYSVNGKKPISVMNSIPGPTVSISSTASSPTNTSPIPVTIIFSESVTDFIAGDVSVTNGSVGNFSGSGTTYTMNIIPTAQGAVTVNVSSGVAADAAGNTNSAAASAFSITYDSIAPTVSISSTATGPTNTSSIPVTITFSESVTDFIAGDVSVTNGSVGNFSGIGTTYTMNITPTAQGAVTVNVASSVATDAAGNTNSAAASAFSITYDSIAPTVSISSTATGPTNTSPIPVTITFSESVTDFIAGDVSVTNGSVGNFGAVSGSGTTYTMNITPTAQGAVTVNVVSGVAADAAGNTNSAAASAFSITYDSIAPTVTLYSPTGTAVSISTESILLQFSETVTAITGKTVTVNDGVNSYVYIISSDSEYLSGSGSSCVAEIPVSSFMNGTTALSFSSATTYTVQISSGAYVDSAGNSNAENASLGNFTINTYYTVTFSTGSGSAVASQSVVSGGYSTKPATDPTYSGYTFGGWYTNNTYATKFNFSTMPITAATTIYAKWTKNSLGGGDSGGTTTTDTADGTTTATADVKSTTDSDGTGTASVTEKQLADAVAAATEEAAKQGTKAAVEISVATGTGATGISVTIPHDSLQTAANSSIDALKISSSIVSVAFDGTALDAISASAAGDLTLKVTQTDSTMLSESDKAIIGSRPVYSLTLNSGGTTISSLGGGTAIVSIPYILAAGEDANKIVIYYISGSGELVTVPNCVYDASTGTVTFTTTHFSNYAVGYNDVSFADVSGWYTDYVSYLSARGIINGTGDGIFSPDASITRAQFVTILARMSGDDLSGYTASSFSDVAATDWYFAAVQWAYENGVATGSDGKFNPNASITRQDIAVMLARYADKVASYTLLKTNSAVTFTDRAKISSYASDAVTAMQQAGIISGNDDGSFAPQADATRAEAAKMIALLIRMSVN